MELLARENKEDSALERKVRHLLFEIECHAFSLRFNSKLIDKLRGDYLRQVAFGANARPPQRKFLPYASTV